MKIDDSKPGPIDVKRPLARDTAAQRSSGSSPQAAGTAGPAASVSLGSGANVAAAASAAGGSQSGALPDVESLNAIRKRINEGQFVVGYGELARLVVGEAMAANRRRNDE